MPIRDVAAQVASLRNDYGATHGPHAPASFEVALYLGDPNVSDLGGGVEVPATTVLVDEDSGDETEVANGYARATIANDGTGFPEPDADTGVLTTALVSFPPSLAEYPDTVTHWLLLDADTGVAWDSGELPRDEQITVEGPGVVPGLLLALFYSSVDPGAAL